MYNNLYLIEKIIIMKFKYIIYLIVIIAFISACEDVIQVDLNEGDNQLVVDAWINNLPETQEIRLARVLPYFENNQTPGELGATIIISEDNGEIYNFEDADNDGTYAWTPAPGATFGNLNGIYNLSIITAEGKEYSAISSMRRVMPVDSIVLENREEELGQAAGIYAEFFARDVLGPDDTYWIKTFKNGAFLNKPQEMNLAWDASFTPGVDGVTFISPIRQQINRVPDSGDDAVDNSELPPWAEGDSISVEIHSINTDAFDFLSQARTQMTLGDAGIFAEPPANVPSNIQSLNATEPSDQAIGFFNVSSVSTLGRKIAL
ncbi:MAG: hypothetical protein ACI94Y_002396 [Maribacter sp.]